MSFQTRSKAKRKSLHSHNSRCTDRNSSAHHQRTGRARRIVYTDTYSAYNALDVSEFHHHRINHSQSFAEQANHINGIENFWNQAKRHLRRFNGIKPEHFYWFLKECEWRFNGGDHKILLTELNSWVKKAKR